MSKALRTKEGHRHVVGGATFLDDVTLNGMVLAAFVRSVHAHAIIKQVSVDGGCCVALEGALTRDDVLRLTRPLPQTKMEGYRSYPLYCLATDRVRFVGEPVALVAASMRSEVEDALDCVQVEYDPLPAVLDISNALNEGAPKLYEEWGTNLFYSSMFESPKRRRGATEGKLSCRISIPRVAGAPMETRGMIASYDKARAQLTVWAAVQRPHVLRSQLAFSLEIPENSIRVLTPDVGGSFGVKGHLFREYVAVAALSLKIGKPVKWIESRSEHLSASVHGRGSVHDVEVSFTKSGRILSIRDDVLFDLGAYPALPYRGYSTFHIFDSLVGPYDIKDLSFNLKLVCTNRCPYGHYRGPGMMEGIFVIERVMEKVAKALGLDPAELRLKNLPSSFPHRTPTGALLDPGSYRESLLKALQASEYKKVRQEQRTLARRERLLGVGVALCAEVTGLATRDMGRRYTYPPYEYSMVRIDLTGQVTVYTGLCPQGQLNETMVAQVVAKELGVKYDDVTVKYGDTDLAPYGGGTGGGSRAAVLGGGSSMAAARKLREKVLRIAAKVLGSPVSTLSIEDGIISNGRDRSVTVTEIARLAILEPDRLPAGDLPLLAEMAIYRPRQDYTFGNSCHVAIVEVDRETGRVAVKRYLVVEDCGEVINKDIVEGQTVGGVVQGIGEALYEEVVYDGGGNQLTSTFMDYTIPSATESPHVEVQHLSTASANLGGYKGVGEGGIVGAVPAIANAVEDALKSAGLMAELDSIPLTAERVFNLIRNHGAPTGE